MTPLPVASSIRASFGGRAGSAVCVYSCVCPCVCVHDLSAAPNVVQWRGWICREWSYGSSMAPILNFSVLTAVTIQGLMSPHMLTSPFHSPHPAGGRDSHSFSSLHKKSLSGCVFYPSSSSPFLSLLSHPFNPSYSTGQVRRGWGSRSIILTVWSQQ